MHNPAIAVILLGALAISTVGCSSPAKDSVELWDSFEGASQAALTTAIDAFEQSHPDVDVRRRTISGSRSSYDPTYIDQLGQALATGDGPDIAVIPCSLVDQFAGLGVLEPVELNNVEALFPAALDSSVFEEVHVAVPMTISPTVIVGNKDKLNELGLDVPSTIPDLLSFGATVRDIIVEGNDDVAGLTMALGNSTDAVATVMTLGAVEESTDAVTVIGAGLRTVERLTAENLVTEPTRWNSQDSANAQLVEGSASVVVTTVSRLATDFPEVDILVDAPPTVAADGDSAVVFSEGNTDAAQKLAAFLGGPEASQLYATQAQLIPADASVARSVNYGLDGMDVAVRAADRAMIWKFGYSSIEIAKVLAEQVNAVANNSTEAKDAQEELTVLIDKRR